MSHQPDDHSLPITIFYEVLPENMREADAAEMNTVANTVVEALKHEGYTVLPVPTGTRGADLLYQIVPFIQASAQIAMTHKNEITSAFNTVKPLVEQIMNCQKQREVDKTAQSAQGAIEVELKFGNEDDTFTFKSSGSEGTEQFRYAFDQFLAHSRHAKTLAQPPSSDTKTVEGTLTIRERVPARPRRRRY